MRKFADSDAPSLARRRNARRPYLESPSQSQPGAGPQGGKGKGKGKTVKEQMQEGNVAAADSSSAYALPPAPVVWCAPFFSGACLWAFRLTCGMHAFSTNDTNKNTHDQQHQQQ